MGGNTYNRRHFNESEISELIAQIDGWKGLFDDRVFDTEKQWRANISRHLDEDSCQRFYFALEPARLCKGCKATLQIDSYHYSYGFRDYCPVCIQNGEFRRNLTPEQRRKRGEKISQAKKKFYQSEYGKSVAKSNGKKISKSLKKFHKTAKGALAREKSRQHNRKLMTERIKNGTFTPNSNNRNTHWDCEWNGKKYRSSWEAAYHQINPTSEYESLRIEYNIHGETKVYIVDFVDHNLRTVAEVKPKELCKDTRTQAKLNSLREWAKKHDYEMILADQDYFIEHRNQIQLDQFDTHTQQKLRNLLS